MSAPDFIVTSDGIRKNIEVPDLDSEIDMQSSPIQGSNLINNLHKLWSGDKSSKFKFIICWFSHPRVNYLEVTDKQKALKKCLDQWTFISCKYDSNKLGEDTMSELETTISISKSTCCCSQYIEKEYFYMNRLNDNILRIGSSCIEKFAKDTTMFDDYERIRKLHRKCQGCKKVVLCTEIGDDLCNSCHSNPSKAEKKICMACLCLRVCTYGRCKACFKGDAHCIGIGIEANKKQCEKCDGDFYPSESWKKICLDCYNAEKTTRNCDKCGDEFAASEDWKKTCKNCFLSSSKLCQDCNGIFLPKGAWQKICYKCYKNKQ